MELDNITPYCNPFDEANIQQQPAPQQEVARPVRNIKKKRIIELRPSISLIILIGIYLFYLFIPKGYQTFNFIDLFK